MVLILVNSYALNQAPVRVLNSVPPCLDYLAILLNLVQRDVVPARIAVRAIIRVISPRRVATALAIMALARVVVEVSHLHPVAPLHGAPLIFPGVERPAAHERDRLLERQKPPAHLGGVRLGVGVGEPRARLAVRDGTISMRVRLRNGARHPDACLSHHRRQDSADAKGQVGGLCRRDRVVGVHDEGARRVGVEVPAAIVPADHGERQLAVLALAVHFVRREGHVEHVVARRGVLREEELAAHLRLQRLRRWPDAELLVVDAP